MPGTQMHVDRPYPLHCQRRGRVHFGSGAPHNEHTPTSVKVPRVQRATYGRCASVRSGFGVGGSDTLP